MRLLRFNPSDWPGACHPECAFWAGAARWYAERPDASLDLSTAPDAPFHPERV